MTEPVVTETVRPSFVRRALGGGFRTESLVTSATSIGLYALGIVTGPLLARALGASGRGRLAAVLTLTGLLGSLATGGFSLASGYLREREPVPALLGNAFLTSAVLALPLLAGAWVEMPRIMHDSGGAVLVARLYLVLLPLTGLTATYTELVRAARAGAGWNALRAIPTVVNAVILVALAIAGHLTLTSALISQLVGITAFTVVCAVRMVPLLPLRLDRAVWRKQAGFARRVFVGFAADAVTNRLDQVVLALSVAPAELGNYAVAVTLSSLSGPATSGLAIALYAHLLRSPVDRRAGHALRLTVVLSTVIAVGVGAASWLLVPLVFGPEFGPARVALLLLLPGQVATDAVQVRFAQLHASGNPGEVSRTTVYSGVVTIVGLLALVPHYGINAAAVVSSAAYLLRYVVAARAVRVRIASGA